MRDWILVWSSNLLERQTEQTKPISTMILWQKHAARKSTLSSVGTAMIRRRVGGERKQVCTRVSYVLLEKRERTIRYCKSDSRCSMERYEPPVRWAACCRNTVSGPYTLQTSMMTFCKGGEA